MSVNKIIICSATLVPENEFFEKTLLGQSLKLLLPVHSEIELQITHGSDAGLAYPYNRAIDSATDNDIIIFMHDDVYIDDWNMVEHLFMAFEQYDIVGVCGNKIRKEHQQAWWCMDVNNPSTIFGSDCRSGKIRHANQFDGSILDFGPSRQSVKLLDGVFIATKASALLKTGVRFDPQFKYHFYDLDFSRQCDEAGLRLGTWPIALFHGSSGGYGETWHTGLATYFKKWGS